MGSCASEQREKNYQKQSENQTEAHIMTQSEKRKKSSTKTPI